jgi:lipid II:glycine glycyltransferase (peptidoglycan interpeptide bridge formation enzyme)
LLFLSLFPLLKLEPNGFSREKNLTLTIDLTKSLDELWSDLKRNNRTQVNRASKEGIKIKITNDYKEFYKIYKNLYKKKGLMPLLGSLGFGIIPLNVFKRYGTLFIAEKDGKLLCGDVYLEGEKSVLAWAGASKRFNVPKKEKREIAWASKLCIWEALKYYKNKKFEEFDFGGMWPEEEAEKDPTKSGINKYKKGFGGQIITVYNYRKIYSKLFNYARVIYGFRNF